MQQKIKVGIIGARADRGWAGLAHVPAVQAVPELKLHAVATRNEATAKAAAEAFGAPLAFGDPFELIRHPDVDLVSIVVKVPEHRALVLAAVAAGKAIYCEWPLGIDLAEANAMAEAARAAGVRTAIGLQGRASPWINEVKRLVASGYVGRLLSTTLVASDDFSSGSVAQGNAYMLDARNGANALTIHAAHFLDSMTYATGELRSVAAVTATTRPTIEVRETGERVTATSPDQIVLAATLAGGAVASVHIRAGSSPGANFSWEIQGEEGFLRVTSPDGYMHWRPLVIEGARAGTKTLERLGEPPADRFALATGRPADAHWNIARAYAAFAQDLTQDTRTVPGFDEAVACHRLIAAIQTAAATGQAQPLGPAKFAGG